MRAATPAVRDCMSHPLSPPDVPAVEDGLSAEAVGALAARSVRRESSASFQALLAAAAEAAARVAGPVREAEAAALNLAQRQHVAAVAADLDAVVGALRGSLSPEAQCLVRRRRPADVVRAVLRPAPGWLPRLRERAAELALPSVPPTRTWVSAAAAAVEALGQTAEHVATLAAAQPAASSARFLGDRVAARLRAHRDTLLGDVARLVD